MTKFSQMDTEETPPWEGEDQIDRTESPRIDTGRIDADLNYRRFPYLSGYIDRIGAEELNFKKFMVKDYKRGGYYVEKTVIKLDTVTGAVLCDNAEYGPTELERERIKEEILGRKFPQSIMASTSANLQDHLGKEAKLYNCYDRKSGEIKMVQERVEPPDGKPKYFRSWSFFDDGQWRMMEPDGNLPFWKPKITRNLSKIMVHEGAKAAQYIDAMLNIETAEMLQRRDEFPPTWLEEVKEFEHWGMLGGALAPHRTDYDELRRENPTVVWYACDNDDEGKNVLQHFSRHYKGKLRGLQFDVRFPSGWDMADEFPRGLYKPNVGVDYVVPEEGDLDFSKVTYRGEPIVNYLKPATWATRRIPNPTGEGRPVSILNDAYKSEWMHCVKPSVFVHTEFSSQIWDTGQFNSVSAPWSDVDDTARLMLKDSKTKNASLSYSPTDPPGMYASKTKNGFFINTHTPTAHRLEEGDPKPWLDLLEHVIPLEDDRHQFERWCYTLIDRPSVKMTYGVLLISERQGVGKTTIGEKVLAPLVGEANTSYPSEKDIVDSAYNYWSAHKRLAVVNEIYAGESKKAYDTLKSVITDKTITVNQKYMASYEIENWIHIFACSNSLKALKINNDDRRWFVPGVTDELRSQDFWRGFNAWLGSGGLGIIRWYAKEWLKDPDNKPVRSGEIAPESSAKTAMIEEGYSSGQMAVKDLLHRLAIDKRDRGDTKPIVLTDTLLVEYVRQKVHGGKNDQYLEKAATLKKMATRVKTDEQTWYAGKERVFSKELGGFGHIISDDRLVAEMDPKRLKIEGYATYDLARLTMVA